MKENNDKVAVELVATFIKSHGDEVKDYDQVFYNKTQSIGLNVKSFLEDLAGDMLEFSATKDARILELENSLNEAKKHIENLRDYNFTLTENRDLMEREKERYMKL